MDTWADTEWAFNNSTGELLIQNTSRAQRLIRDPKSKEKQNKTPNYLQDYGFPLLHKFSDSKCTAVQKTEMLRL